MQPTKAFNLPDNLLSKVSRLYIRSSEFKADNGEVVKYDRVVIQVLVKGEVFELEYKPEKKDKAILLLADNLDNNSL